MEVQSTSPPSTSPSQQLQSPPQPPQPQDHKHPHQSTTTTRSTHRIKSHPSLSPFRRRIYLVLLSIPPGRWTTYAALARYMATTTSTSSSSPSSSNSPPSSSTAATATTNKPNPNPKPPGTKLRSKPKGAIGSARAVGTAMRTNPFAPDVPCHRVLASDGTLGGYMGDGPSTGGRNLQRKREMLEAEGVRFLGDGEGEGGGLEGKKGKKGKGKEVRAVGECWVDFVG